MSNYNYSVKRYYNSVDGVRYNVSFTRPQYRDRHKLFFSFLRHVRILSLPPSRFIHSSDIPIRRERRSILLNALKRLKHIRFHSYRFVRFGKLVNNSSKDYKRDRSNVLRAIREIRNIGLANDWSYFVTFTIDPKLHDRTDYRSVAKKMTQYFRNLRKRGYDIEYLLIPELHRDYVNYHFHGLLRGNIDSLLSPHPLKWQAEQGYLDFPEFARRFGFVSLSPVKTTNFVVYYVLKYINKQFTRTKWNEGMRMYYVSRNIVRPQEVKRMNLDISPEFLANNFNFTDYNSAYFRGLCEEQLFESENQFLFEDCFYSQQYNESEVF